MLSLSFFSLEPAPNQEFFGFVPAVFQPLWEEHVAAVYRVQYGAIGVAMRQ